MSKLFISDLELTVKQNGRESLVLNIMLNRSSAYFTQTVSWQNGLTKILTKTIGEISVIF